jgi:hypothetical protein
MAGRVKTASEDGKAMHAPMLAAVREKRNWKFDGGGAWRELFRMKPSQLPLIAVALLLAGMVFIVFDRSQPVKSIFIRLALRMSVSLKSLAPSASHSITSFRVSVIDLSFAMSVLPFYFEGSAGCSLMPIQNSFKLLRH